MVPVVTARAYITVQASSNARLSGLRGSLNEGLVTLYIGDCIASLERIPAEVERLASDLIELSTRYNFAFWLPGANVLRGWARNATGDKVEGAVRNDPAFVFPSSSAWKRASDAWEVIAFLEAEPVEKSWKELMASQARDESIRRIMAGAGELMLNSPAPAHVGFMTRFEFHSACLAALGLGDLRDCTLFVRREAVAVLRYSGYQVESSPTPGSQSDVAAELRSISPDAGSVRTRPCKNKASHR